ncbi:MAG: chromate transporter, partial [Burkholderiales bacterium]|nr:chromate transporter [Burkholderiales bacterium]
AIRRGLSPIAIGLTLSAGWIIAVTNDTDWKLALLSVVAFGFFLFSRRNPLWLIAAGALVGGFGLI